jgi:hypothetical protein
MVMAFGTPLLKLCPIIGVAILGSSVASHKVDPRACSLSPTAINVAAQQAIKDRLRNLHFPIFSYSADDQASVSNDGCGWTVLGHVEAQTDDGVRVRLGWAVNILVKPGELRTPPDVASSIVFLIREH